MPPHAVDAKSQDHNASMELTAQALTETICCSTCFNCRSTWADEECPAWLEVASWSSSLLRVQARAVHRGAHQLKDACA